MKKKIFIASICVLVVLVVSIGMFWYYHPTHYRYNDRFILGNTEENIVERYGDFSKKSCNNEGELIRGIYMVRDNTPELIMSYDNSLWYEIYFEDGIAVEVRMQKGWYGG